MPSSSSIGPIPPPMGAMNCFPEVRKATASEFELVNPSKQSNFIIGELAIDGQLSFIVENLPKDGFGCRGRWIFDQMMLHFGSSVTTISGFWIGPLSDNLKEVNNLTSKGIAIEAAAMTTWTSKRAASWGYAKLQVISILGSPGSYRKVHVLFKR